MLAIGLMSGTSMDGIDAALLATDGSENLLNPLGHFALGYEPPFKIILKATEWVIRQMDGDLLQTEARYGQTIQDYLCQELKLTENEAREKLAELSAYLQTELTLPAVMLHSTALHYRAIQQLLVQTGYTLQQIDVIGYHGQTMLHRPSRGFSILIGDGQWLANQTQVRVVTDFRKQDISLGGQGAPFAPLYHQALAVRDRKIPLAVVNCGGIANVTFIANNNILDLLAWDTGPGNGLIDQFVRGKTYGREQMDKDGHYGKKGSVHHSLFNVLYEKTILQEGQNYFGKKPPKSLDIGDLTLIPEIQTLSIEDGCATLEAFTADTIVASLQFFEREYPQHWVLAGGGWYNPVIRRELTMRLAKKIPKVVVQTADECGWSNQAMEAQTFAYLAVRSLQNKPLSVPGTTRVAVASRGGEIFSPGI